MDGARAPTDLHLAQLVSVFDPLVDLFPQRETANFTHLRRDGCGLPEQFVLAIGGGDRPVRRRGFGGSGLLSRGGLWLKQRDKPCNKREQGEETQCGLRPSKHKIFLVGAIKAEDNSRVAQV